MHPLGQGRPARLLTTGRSGKESRAILWLGFFLALPFCFSPLSNPDLPWHLSAARWMLAHGRLPDADFLSWTRAGAPWTDFEWATQLLYYGLEHLGGTLALWLFKGAVFTALLGLFAGLTRLWGLSGAWAGLGFLPLIIGLTPALDIRPENLSLLLCLLQLYLLESWRLRKHRTLSLGLQAFLHFALYAAWVNLHAGFAMGLALGGLYGIGEALQGASKDRLRFWAAAGAGAFAGTLLNPFGFGVYTVSWEHYRLLSMLSAHILEWQEPSVLNVYQWPFWAVLLFSFAVSARHFVVTRSTPYAHLLALGFFGLSAASHSRNTSYFCIVSFPLALLAASQLRREVPWKWGFLALFTVLAYGVFRAPEDFRMIHDPRYEPERAAAFLRREASTLSPLRLYNPWAWGGYLGYRLHPDFRIFLDGRYLFHEFLPDLRQAQQDPDTWNRYLDGLKVDVVLVENRRQWIADPDQPQETALPRPIDRYFFPRARWALVWWDPMAMVFVRRSGVPKAWLAQREYRVLYPKDQAWLQAQALKGKLDFRTLEREIERHRTEDPASDEAYGLAGWLEEVRRALAGRKSPPSIKL